MFIASASRDAVSECLSLMGGSLVGSAAVTGAPLDVFTTNRGLPR
jgi:hypothetical protein